MKALGQRMETPFLFWIVHTLKKKNSPCVFGNTWGVPDPVLVVSKGWTFYQGQR